MSQFKKGMPRPPNSGRRKGVPNKKKLKKVAQILAENNLCPVTHILKLLEFGDLKDADRIKAYFDLLSYCQGKPKEDSGLDEDDEELIERFSSVSDEKLLALVESNE